MSLRDLGVFAPLRPDHPAVGKRCGDCGSPLGPGTRTGLRPLDPDARGTVEAILVCATCKLRGVEIQTPDGRTKVTRIKQGSGSPYPIETADGHQWREDEVAP